MAEQQKEIIAKLNHVVKHYPGVEALNGVSFEIKKGHIHGLLGPNGAGKSTLMNILTGLIPPTSGEVELFGQPHTERQKLANRIGFLAETPPLYPTMTVRAYLEFVLSIHHLKAARKQIKQQAAELLQKCGLEAVRDRIIGNLSKGYRQRVGIAQALSFNPEFIILDEPTVGLDPDVLVDVRKLILGLAPEHTVLLSSHILSEVELMCDEITIIRKGQVIQSGSLESLRSELSSEIRLVVKVKNFSSSVKSRLEESFEVTELKLKEVDSCQLIEMSFAPAADDLLSDVSRFFVENKCGLYHFESLRPDLEDIFHRGQEKMGENR